MTGVIKTVLSLQHRTIPGLAHFESANPNIDFSNSPFYVTKQASPWTAEGPLRAGVSAFGVGGVNAHVVLEEAPALPKRTMAKRQEVLCVSARTPAALKSATQDLAAYLEANKTLPLGDVAYTLNVGRRAMQYRFSATAKNIDEAIHALRVADVDHGTPTKRRRLAFQFSGQGSQFAGMGPGSLPLRAALQGDCGWVLRACD